MQHDKQPIIKSKIITYGYDSVGNKSVSTWNRITNKIKTDMITESTINVKNSLQNQLIEPKYF